MVFTSYTNIISPLGFSTAENHQAVSDSKIGVKKMILPFSTEAFCVGKIDEEQLKQQFAPIGKIDAFTKLEQLSILSIQDVIHQSGINSSDDRTLLIYSTTKGNIDILENIYKNIDSKRVYLPAFVKQLQSYFKFVHTPVVFYKCCI
jgi:3-oxoacyl-[acyl-carrier-protein] synthase-1